MPRGLLYEQLWMPDWTHKCHANRLTVCDWTIFELCLSEIEVKKKHMAGGHTGIQQMTKAGFGTEAESGMVLQSVTKTLWSNKLL